MSESMFYTYKTKLDTALAGALPVALEGYSDVSEAHGTERVQTRLETQTLTLRLEVWQLRQDWVVLFLRLFEVM